MLTATPFGKLYCGEYFASKLYIIYFKLGVLLGSQGLIGYSFDLHFPWHVCDKAALSFSSAYYSFLMIALQLQA
jgi:hypothetical protein